MIKEGCLKGVDECYGYHNFPMDKEGVLVLKSGLVMVIKIIKIINFLKFFRLVLRCFT